MILQSLPLDTRKYSGSTPFSDDRAGSRNTSTLRRPACPKMGHCSNIYKFRLWQLFSASRMFTDTLTQNRGRSPFLLLLQALDQQVLILRHHLCKDVAVLD